MRNFLIYILFISTITYSYTKQAIVDNRTLEKKSKNTLVKKSTIGDTTKLIISKKPLDIPTSLNTKIILLKEEPSGSDWIKYILPIFTLLVGIGINRFIDMVNTRKRILKTGERWIVEIQSIEEPIKNQIESLNNFKGQLTTQDFIPPTLSIMTAINGEVYKSLDKNELIKFIELKSRESWYKKLSKLKKMLETKK